MWAPMCSVLFMKRKGREEKALAFEATVTEAGRTSR